MPKYVIERDVPGAGQRSPQQLQAIAQTSCPPRRGCETGTEEPSR